MNTYNILKVKKKFDYNGIELQIVEREEPYMNGKEPLKMTRVIAPNGGSIPININHRQTLKSIMEDTIRTLDGFKERGAYVINELTKKID
jgi:hypothetical protein